MLPLFFMDPASWFAATRPQEAQNRIRGAIVEVMRSGGYWDAVMGAGSDLDRVKQYLIDISENRVCTEGYLAPAPFPVFPGLNNRPFHDASKCSLVEPLQEGFETIRREVLGVGIGAAYVSNLARAEGKWLVSPMAFLGGEFKRFRTVFPNTAHVLRNLDRACFATYPFGDAVLSAQTPGATLEPHCSTDNLRLRCHLPISGTTGCSITVASETRGWTPGEPLLFEDAFLHEVHHRGHETRIVLIVDFWHPDLTDVEISALSQGFMNPAVRRILHGWRFLANQKSSTDWISAEYGAFEPAASPGALWASPRA